MTNERDAQPGVNPEREPDGEGGLPTTTQGEAAADLRQAEREAYRPGADGGNEAQDSPVPAGDSALTRDGEKADGEAFAAAGEGLNKRGEAEGTPLPDGEEAVQTVPDEAEAGPPLPLTHDLKEVWVDYAVSQGANRADAEGMTKAELVDQYMPPAAAGI